MDPNSTEPSSSPASTTIETHGEKIDAASFWAGVGLAVLSSIFIGASFIIKKRALLRLSKQGRRANLGSHGYLKDFLWWAGLLSMAVGEAANFVAYAFAPASLVATLGVLSVLVATILASRFLKERLNFLGKLGCFLCAIGSTVIVLHSPDEKNIKDMEDLEAKIAQPLFISYVIIIVVLSLILIYNYRPKYPENSTKTLMIWLGVCSGVGSLSVMLVKACGLAILETISGTRNEFKNWLTWLCLISLVLCVSVQMNFLNKALDSFNTAIVTPIYYVLFTTFVVIASAILFREFEDFPAENWVGVTCGFSTVLTAIILLHFCKNYDITLEKLAQQIKITSDEHEEQPSQFVPVPDYRTSDSDSEGDQVHSKASKKGNSYGSVAQSA